MALPFNPHDPDDPGPGPYPKRPDRTTPGPRPESLPTKTAGDKGLTGPETNRAISILHGTAKMQGTVIEQYSGILYSGPLRAPYWLPNAPYSIGDRVTANGNTYVATKAGISAVSGTGPSGTGTNIVDGITSYGAFSVDISVRWDFQTAGTFLYWTPSTAYNVQGLVTVVYANGNFYVCVVSGTSAATGTGPTGTDPAANVVDNTCQWKYIPPGWHVQMAVAFCEGQIFGGRAGYGDAGIFRDYTAITSDYIQLFNGTPTGIGARNALFPTPDSVQRDDYSNVAVLLVSAGTGADNKITNIALELASGTGVDATHQDENPADIAIDLLTDGRRGAGWASARVDSAGAGTLGTSAAGYRKYCTANGLLLSWAIDTATPAIELLGMLLAATNSDPVWSNGGSLGGMLKIVPRGDQALTANGVTYTPVTTPVFNLTSDDIIGPIEIVHRGSSTAFNSIPIEFTDRALGYVRNTVDDPDMADVDKRGLQRGAIVALPQVIAPAVAVMLSRIYAQRSLKVRNQYRFRLSHRFMLLEPTDIVTLADSVMGMPARPVRITAMEEEQTDGTFLFEAEDYPVAVAAAAQYTPQTGDGFGPLRGTTTARAPALPATQSASTVTDTSSTRGSAVHNVWPNGSSEMDPPDGANTTTAEWAARVNTGTAFAGNWVRQLTSTLNQRVAFGDDLLPPGFYAASPTFGATLLGAFSPCSPGDVFVFEYRVRMTTGVGPQFASLDVRFADSTRAGVIGGGAFGSGPLFAAGAWVKVSSGPVVAPAGACFILFQAVSTNNNATPAVMQFDAIKAYRYTETSSDAASIAPALTLAAGGNTFTDIPGTSQSFTPITDTRKIKVTLCFSASSNGVFTTSPALQVRIAFGGTPTQAGSAYNFAYTTAQHLSWTFMWALPAATLGPVGTAVPVKAQVKSPTTSGTSLVLNGDDSVSMIIEEIG